MRPQILLPVLGALALLPAAPAVAGGCCGSASLYAQPQVAPVLWAQPVPAPTVYAWPRYSYSSCGGCGGASYYGGVSYYGGAAVAKQPIYVVNQGPHYSGSGIMVTGRTWKKGGYAGYYPYVGAHPGWYDGGPYADPLGHRYIRRYGYHEQFPAGYRVAPYGPRIITRPRYAPRYGVAPRYAPAYVSRGPRVYAPRRRPVVVRANAEVRHMGNRMDVRLYRVRPAKRPRNHGY
jgi:hypothetical protein